MIEITDGFTRIDAGTDPIQGRAKGPGRSPTGARVVLEFCREMALAEDQAVMVRYDFAEDGKLREGTGFATPIRTVVRWGRTVLYHYRLSYWIAASALSVFVSDKARARLNPPMPEMANGIRASDPSRV
jgi:hypothetical protein